MIEIFGGAALGIALGWVLQSGGFCMNSAFRSILFEKDKSLLRAWLLVVLINVPAITLLQDFGVLYPQTAPLFWPALIVGGLMFGVGMVMAGGCASGTYYRAGRGMLGSWAALTGFLAGTAAMDGGALFGIQRVLRQPVLDVQGREATLFNLTGLESTGGRWLLVTLLMLPIIWYLLRAPKQKFLIGWGWQRTGLLVGLLALGAWLLSAAVGRDFGLSFTQPSTAFARMLIAGDGSGVGLPLYILLGVPLGAYLSAYRKGEAAWRAPDPRSLVRQAGGGLTMGLGASLAGGCNIGHGITGIATLGIGSMLGVLSIMAGCWIMTWMIIRSHRVPA
ncbi:YeeE/YedE family protein [Spirochaeta africana]|uniref:Putative transporter component n=1 Tax=Spirochaeta africana (strain ATCC 700263 / DSM 8902 / Z-7692) TaxID=889378 RepID=H9UIN1_SPIAZ|nr:YeeE/YedE family protein [Spirochaeta africana]AFG37374.1 putative transporter component [Spirochaeta africana DSM 8902]